jgi:hypothetical protein
MGVSTARDITACRLNRNQTLSRNQPRRELGFKFRHTRKLRFGEFFNARIRKLDVVASPLREALTRSLDLLFRDDNLAGPFVQISRVFASLCLAP